MRAHDLCLHPMFCILVETHGCFQTFLSQCHDYVCTLHNLCFDLYLWDNKLQQKLFYRGKAGVLRKRTQEGGFEK